MEDTLRVKTSLGTKRESICLNPCFNGRYSQSTKGNNPLLAGSFGLNPCFNGRYSQSTKPSKG